MKTRQSRSGWRSTTLGEVVNLRRGFDLPENSRTHGSYPVYSSSGITGNHNVPAGKGPGVITGRYGTIGKVFLSEGPYWPLNTTLYVDDFKGNNPQFIYYLLKTVPWQEYTTASAVPGINRNHLHRAFVHIPDLEVQETIALFLRTIDDKIEINNRLNDYLAA